MKMTTIVVAAACLMTIAFVHAQAASTVEGIKQKAAAGDAMAQAQYAQMLQSGQGIEKNEAEALKWYQKAAEAGNSYAQANMGVFCQTGSCGMTKDLAKAAEWYDKAAKQGNAHAQYYLARLYESGNGVESNAKKAVELYGKAANGGMPTAQLVYALKLSQGEGIDRNIDESLKWAEKAAAAGDRSAVKLVKLLKELKDSNVTGTDIVNGNGEKESGYSSAQLDGIKERLAGKVLTFENGKVSSVSKGYDGKVDVTMSFLADKSKGFFASRFMVSAKVSDEADKKWAACLDEGAEITKVTGKVTKGGMFFTIEDAKIVPAKMPEVKRMFDPEKVVGQDVVNCNGIKESGYSSAQLDQAKEELAGKVLTFENGKVSSVSKGYDGTVNVTMSFLADKSKGFFASRFMVEAKVSDQADKKWAACLDEGAEITKVTGKVTKGGMFFTIEDAKIVPAKMPEVKRMFDPEKVVGQDVVNGNGVKESGYSSAQLDQAKEELAGKVLTFENGKVSSVSKGYDGTVNVTMSFLADKSKGFFASRFMVSAKVSDPEAIKWVQNIDEGASIKSVTGKVDKGGMFFTIVDVKIVVGSK